MYHLIIPFDNSTLSTEKNVNPRSMAITPSQVAKLTSEGQATCMQALSGCTYYPDLPADAELPMEYKRGVDINDTWEASYYANKKVSEYLKSKDATSTTSKTED